MKRPWSVHSLASSTCVLLLALVVAAPTPPTAAALGAGHPRSNDNPRRHRQARPGPFTGGRVSTQANAAAGRMCGGSFGTGSASERGILYSCKFPQPGQFSVCSFVQECSFGCQTQSAPNLNRNDVCATAPPFPVAINPELVEGGRPSNGAVFLSAPAASLTSAHVNSSPVGLISPLGGFDIPQGATTAPFDVDTLGVAVPAFVQVRADLFLNTQQRYAQDYLAVVPVAGSRPPSR